jgi:amino acid permease
MGSEELFSREEVLGGLPAQRARTLLFLIESRTAQLVEHSRRAMERYLSEERAEARDMAFFTAFSAGKDPPLHPTIQDLERFSGRWASLVPENPGLRAAVAHLFGGKYAFTEASVPGIRRVLELDGEAVRRAYQRQYGRGLETIYAARPAWLDRLRWAWTRLANWLESLPPFWTAFALTLTETVGAGIMALPIALAGIGPLAGVGLVILMGLVNMVTIAFMAEAVSRSGEIRYGSTYLGRLVADYLGGMGSAILSTALATISALALLAYFIGLSTTLEDATRAPAGGWALLLFLVNFYFLRKRTLNATVSAALLVGAVNIAVILSLAAITIPWIRAEYLTYVNLPFLQGQPFDPSILQLVFGVVLVAYFGHTSMANCAKVVLRRDPSSRSLIWGTVAAQFAAIALYSIWLFTINGAVPPEELASISGTALEPLANRVGPVVHILGSIFVILGMGMASIHFSLGFFNLTQEWLPKRHRPVVVLKARKGRILLQKNSLQDASFRLSLVYLGFVEGQPRFSFDVQAGTERRRLEMKAADHLDPGSVLQYLPEKIREKEQLQVDILESQEGQARLCVQTSLSMSFDEGWVEPGMGTAGLISLPGGQRKVMDWIMRHGKASLGELAAHTGSPEKTIQPDLADLVSRGFLTVEETLDEVVYRPRLVAKKARNLPEEIWEALGETGPSQVVTDSSKGGLRRRLSQAEEALLSEPGRFLIGILPLGLVFLLTEWLLLTEAESFSRPLSFIGVIAVSLLGGMFPALLLVASRRKGERTPQGSPRFLGHPLLIAGVFILSLTGLFLHGLVIWQNPLERAAALATGLTMVIITMLMVRARVFAPRLILELREERVEQGKATFAITVAGQGLPGEVQLEYAEGRRELSASGGELPGFTELRSAVFRLPIGEANDMKVWAHRVSIEGESEGLPARLEVQRGEKVDHYDLQLSRGRALISLRDVPDGVVSAVRFTFAGRTAG